MGVLVHTQMNTLVKERRALQQRTQRGVEGKFPTQSHRPLMPRGARRAETKHYDTFFSVRRLLGSRQVVTQCLCQLNELCSILHRLLFGSIKREHGPIHSPNVVHVRWRPHEENHTKQTKNHKSTNPTEAKQNKSTKPKPGKTHIVARTSQLCANQALRHAKPNTRQPSRHTGQRHLEGGTSKPGPAQRGSPTGQRGGHQHQIKKHEEQTKSNNRETTKGQPHCWGDKVVITELCVQTNSVVPNTNR